MAEKVNQGIELVKAGANVLGQFYQDLAQPSVKALGQALATVFELCPNSLLSLKLWTEKRKLNFAKRLNEYKDKLEQIPEEKRCEVDTQIGTPIVEKLTYTTNDEIADFLLHYWQMLLILTPLIVLILHLLILLVVYQKMRHESFNTCEQL